MPRRKPTTIYRSLFADAWRVARDRRSLWVFGLFAALLSTGGVCEMAAKGFHRLSTMRDVYGGMLRGTFTGAGAFGRFVQDAVALDPSRVTAAVTLATLFGALAVIASVASQGALIAGAGPKEISDREAAASGRASFWHLLALNFLNKAAHAALILVTALPLFLLMARADGTSMALALLTFLVAFPLTVVISVLFMLASVHVVRHDDHALDAIHHAFALFRTHWLAAFETGVFLFGAVMVAAFAFSAGLVLLAIPFVVLVFLALLSGNAGIFMAVNVLAAAAFVLLVFAFAGAFTTFQYAVWVGFYDHAAVKNRVISKVHRIWRGR